MNKLSISDTSFEKEIEKHPNLLIRFTAEWCGTCKSTQNAFDKFVSDGEFQDYKVAEMNAPESPKARLKAGVYAVPYYAIYRDGKLLEGISTTSLNEIKDLTEQLASR
ncbi:thioredoxin family protein [Mangrovivirga cuniculi]|uniref:Thioredoxin domain-containing protein n=1 Tax=Mangrovivirga cuniculi TaxID=2715131 RepID=A0A4D7JL41_9BACT|nr:thioredoxin family protein [Mangrovivirga cuniculi]QCK14220.1 hypothetical protein DCC35_05400 [Mangrovivirga cuniculi]